MFLKRLANLEMLFNPCFIIVLNHKEARNTKLLTLLSPNYQVPNSKIIRKKHTTIMKKQIIKISNMHLLFMS
jgi:hypothetical protein